MNTQTHARWRIWKQYMKTHLGNAAFAWSQAVKYAAVSLAYPPALVIDAVWMGIRIARLSDEEIEEIESRHA